MVEWVFIVHLNKSGYLTKRGQKIKKFIVLSITASMFLLQNIYVQETQELKSIIVTAQKTEQISQDVPMSLSVFDEYWIEDTKIETVKDIAQYTPNFMVFDYGSGLVRPVVRGLSPAVTALSSSAGMFGDKSSLFKLSLTFGKSFPINHQFPRTYHL